MGNRVLRTPLCDMLDIEYPILSAGMGPNLIGEETGSTADLVVAVSEAGGLGVLGASGYSVEEMRQVIREVQSRTDKPFGVDLLLPKDIVERGGIAFDGPKEVPLSEVLKTLPKPYYEWVQRIKDDLQLPEVDMMVKMDMTPMRPLESVDVCIEERVPLICAGLGNPGFMVERARQNGLRVLGITGNARNARRLAQSGVDILVAQGYEAGGHTGRIGTMALLPQAIDAAAPIPVLAAGGIGDGRGLAAALAMGCAGIWVGTRFLATKESGASEINKQCIIDSSDEDTRKSRLYTGKTSRSNYNKFHDLWDQSGLEALPFPMQVSISSMLIACFTAAERRDYIGGFAGQISGLIDNIPTAREVLEEMVDDAVTILSELPKRVTFS